MHGLFYFILFIKEQLAPMVAIEFTWKSEKSWYFGEISVEKIKQIPIFWWSIDWNVKNIENLVKYGKILKNIDWWYIFSNFVSGSIDIGYIKDISMRYPDVLNLTRRYDFKKAH